MNKTLPLVALLIATTAGFTACNLTGKVLPAAPASITVQKTILAGCDIFDAAMPWVAKGMRSGRIPKTGPARVDIDKAIAYASPICTADPIPTSLTDVGLAELFHSGATLAAASATVQASP